MTENLIPSVSNLLEQVEQCILERKLFRRGDSILVAVSGGLDSMVLLHLLHEMAASHQWRLCVAHFNHQLRGRSSDADESLVRRAARKLRLACACGAGDVKAQSKKSGSSIEMAARSLRHDFLAKAAARQGCGVIALAHHRDDQVELFFLRLLRGAGAEGLAGMKWRNPSSANAQVHLARPLLSVGKPDLAAYAEAQKIAFREDASNVSTKFLRNRIRHELLPFVERCFEGNVRESISRAAEILRAESELLDADAHRWMSRRQHAFERLPEALQRRVIQLQLHQLGVPVDFELIEKLRLRCDQAATASAGKILSRNAAGVVRRHEATREIFSGARKAIKIADQPGECRFGGLELRWQRQGKSGTAFEKNSGIELFDAAKIGRLIELRHWRSGDRFRPVGLGHEVKLQDWFTNQKIPRDQRHELIIATTEDGTIFWVEGQRIDERFKLTAGTKDGLVWRWQRG